MTTRRGRRTAIGLLLALIAVACTPDDGSSAAGTPTATMTTATSTSAPAGTAAPRTASGSPTAKPEVSAKPTVTPGPKDDPVVVAAGDIACDPAHAAFNGGKGTDIECRQQATADLVSDIDPDAVLALGDLQYEVAKLAEFKASYDKSWGRFKDITYPAPGNHEYGTGVAPGYYDYFGKKAGDRDKGYYSADIGRWHLVALNSNCHLVGGCRRGSPMERWLRADLARNRSRCTVAIWHHPRWSSGLHGSAEKVDGLWRTLVSAKVDLLLTGHDHDYERFAPLDAEGRPAATGVRQFVVGTGGRNLYFFGLPQRGSERKQSQAFGVLKLTLHDDGYSWEFVAVPGEDFTDSGTGRCS